MTFNGSEVTPPPLRNIAEEKIMFFEIRDLLAGEQQHTSTTRHVKHDIPAPREKEITGKKEKRKMRSFKRLGNPRGRSFLDQYSQYLDNF